MSQPVFQAIATDVTRCCADVYSNELVTLLLGETWHPGGLDLTHRLGELVRLAPALRVLDVASGVGGSAIMLAEEFGCAMVGIDASEKNVAEATACALRSPAGERVRFVTGEASRLPFPTGAFDVVLCECALCIFADQTGAVDEFVRVLKPGGWIGLSDVTRNGQLPDELDNILSWIACLAGARSIGGYVELLEHAGCSVLTVEEQRSALQEILGRIRCRIVGIQLLAGTHQLDLPGVDFERATAIARSAEASVRDGRLSYVLLAAQVPESEGD